MKGLTFNWSIICVNIATNPADVSCIHVIPDGVVFAAYVSLCKYIADSNIFVIY